MDRQMIFAANAAANELMNSENNETNDAATNIRLNSLRQAALTILDELESLKVTAPESIPGQSCSLRLYDEVRRFEVNLIKSALSRTGGSQTQAARLLGVKLTTLNSKIKRYHIEFAPFPHVSETMRHESAA
jgi:transcriptional regulator with GAF, ATPase, and Fis domain